MTPFPRLWQLSYPIAVRRLAQRLADRAQDGEIPDLQRDIYLLAEDDPRKTAQLVLALAELAAKSLAPPLPTDDPEMLEVLRAAHAAYNRGIRVAWVIDGERDYQREKKRRQRQAKLSRTG